jgi:hypothetical protein
MAVTRITTQLIADLAITTVKIAANAVTLGKLGALNAKGALITYDGSDHVARTVGTNGQVLVADSAQTSGLAWADSSSIGTGVPIGDMIFGETPTGAINGTNDEFTLAEVPHQDTIRVYLNGVRMREGGSNDYEVMADTIMFQSGQIPQTGDILLVDYIKDQS